jgi:cytochrome c biogenesis protein CcmG, thiol:disulfide interchange protein DsbE
VTDPATPPEPDSTAPEAGPIDPPRQARPARPNRPIAILVGIAALTTLAIVVFVNVTRPTGSRSPNIAVGQPVPNITGTTLDGSTVNLAALRGHPLVINFWGPSCVPCRDEMPLLAQKVAEHRNDGLVILGVLTDDPVDPARQFASQYGGTWQTVIDPGAALKRAYRVLGRPQTFFVDKDGILRSMQIGPLTDSLFEQKLAQIAGGS